MTNLWRSNASVKTWYIPKSCPIFRDKYDAIQEQLHTISCMDDLLSGNFPVVMEVYVHKSMYCIHFSLTV